MSSSFENQSPSLETDCRTVHDMLADGDDIVLLDCREQVEVETVSLDGAVWLPMSEIQTRLEEINEYRDRPLVIFCHHGARSLQVAGWLRQQGFSRAQSMAGGIDAWAVDINPALPRY